MPYKRDTRPHLTTGDELTGNMVGIGMLFAATAAPQPDIEDTLISASIEGMERKQLRVLAVLATWLGVHSKWINIDRLTRSLAHVESKRALAFWAGVAHWQRKDRRFARVRRLHRGGRVDAIEFGSDFHVARGGEDPRFVGGPLRVPAKNLRDRLADVMLPEHLAKRHQTYRWRMIMGPSYRADMWAALELNPELTSFALATQVRGSFGTAWQVKQEWQLLAA
ncbi:MAG: hypothetical protein V3T05_04545 [Myxococcota bacterium]